MAPPSLRRPRLPSHFYVFCEPPDASGDETLFLVSERRRIKLKGHSFREFQRSVVPLLDGRHSLAEIHDEVADVFAPEDLDASLALLAEQGILEEGDGRSESPSEAGLEPQLNFFREVSAERERAQDNLATKTVAVIGLSGPGAYAALALGAARVGGLRLIDPLVVAATDPYLAPTFLPEDVGAPRVDVLRRRLEAVAPQVTLVAHQRPLDSDGDIGSAIDGAHFVVCCVDPGRASILYKLNRVCLAAGTPWTSCASSGLEVVVGPTVHPGRTACYLCYRMRAAACAENPNDDFALQRFLDLRKRDDSSRRENLVFAAGLAGNLVGMETLKELTGLGGPVSAGRIAVIDLMELSLTKHVVLRKPWCPACFASTGAAG